MPSQSPVGSRMAIVLGEAVRGAAAELKLKLRRIGAHVLGVDVDEVGSLDGAVATAFRPAWAGPSWPISRCASST